MSRELAMMEKMEKELSLKELQIKSLLTITQAINENVSTEGLFNMYKSFLSWEMGIELMSLFIPGEEEEEGWICASEINFSKDKSFHLELVQQLLEYNRLHTIKPDDPKILRDFDIIIPVFHKKKPIAYAIIGGIKDKEDLYNKIQFITTITNIIAVAIENKRLFKRQIQQERLGKEMELAKDVQHMLIPEKLPIQDNFELASIYRPHFNVGGDYFDYIPFDKDRFAFCIADISGKGVAAALLMANFQAIIQSLIYQYRDLETFVFALNQSVVRITKSDKFITFFIAEVDTKAMTLKYVNAGHYPPILKMGNQLRTLDSGCTVIGAFEKLPEIKEEVISIEEDAMVLTFTDGLAEMRDESGEFFEHDKIMKFVSKHADLSATEFNNQLLDLIDKFRGDQEYTDDIAILTCKIHKQ